MKFFSDNPNEDVRNFLESQSWKYFEWFNQGLEDVSIDVLEKENLIIVGSLIPILKRHPLTLGDYTYMLDDINISKKIVRRSPKIPAPKEHDVRKFTLTGIKEVLN